MERGMNVLALVKGTERYVFLYDDESHRALLQTMGRFRRRRGFELHLVRRGGAQPKGPASS